MTDAKKPNEKQKFTGEPPSDEIENGIIEVRECRDVLCCLIFIAFFVAFGGVTIWALTNGNPETIGRGYDADGKLCGYDSGYEDYQYLYIPIPDKDYFTKTLCVSVCPDSSDTSIQSISCKTNSVYTDCDVRYYDSDGTFTSTTAVNPGDILLYATKGLFSRYCVPTSATKYAGLSKITDQVMNTDAFQDWISDVRTCWGVILGMAGVAVLLGFVYMFLLRYCAGIMIWTSILGIIAVLAVLGGLYFTGAKNISEFKNNVKTGNFTGSVDDSSQSHKILAYVCWGIAGFILLTVLCLYSRIKLAIAIMKAAADFVKSTPSVFIIPPVMFFVLIAFYAYSGITAIYLFSSGDPVQASGLPVGSYSYNTTQKRLLLYTVFAVLWGNAFINASTQFVISSSVCIWYYAQPEGDAHAPVRRSFKNLFRYHLGSIAFGSFILAVVQFIRLVLAYIDQKTKNATGENRVLKCVLKCAQCLLWCFEKCIKFLNKNAYIQIALTGKSFCGAAKDAFFYIVNNPIRYGVTSGISAIFVAFGKLCVAAAATLIGYIIIQNAKAYKDTVYSPVIPSICIFVISWGIASVFLSVYGLAGDTILACFIAEEHICKNKNKSPSHVPSTLKDFLEKYGEK